ncbi:ExbD/TolR family protein [Psychromonas sp.]|uniref:ExbD/TolR family protein n=1 Tax=Psychromonas sp. TaxID=1884585 RepID=UPI0035633523
MLLDLSLPRRKQAISLTPLIDVVFILLLFFMLSSSFSQWRQIKLPASSESQQASLEVITVTLDSDGDQFTLQDKRYRSTDLNALSTLISAKPEAVFAIAVEKNGKTQVLINLLDNFKKAGATNVSFAGVVN